MSASSLSLFSFVNIILKNYTCYLLFNTLLLKRTVVPLLSHAHCQECTYLCTYNIYNCLHINIHVCKYAPKYLSNALSLTKTITKLLLCFANVFCTFLAFFLYFCSLSLINTQNYSLKLCVDSCVFVCGSRCFHARTQLVCLSGFR